jgi:uncharacterized protein YkwD
MPTQSRMGLLVLALSVGLCIAASAHADDYAGAISAYRRAHGLPAVRSYSHLGAVALKQAQADSAGHRENLLMTGARRVGVASVRNPNSPYRKFWAMVITD